jgi:hypothetical protein
MYDKCQWVAEFMPLTATNSKLETTNAMEIQAYASVVIYTGLRHHCVAYCKTSHDPLIRKTYIVPALSDGKEYAREK